jgi:sarcosine oxidase
MPTKHFDVIVLGVGGMGSAATFELARRGLSVLGLEQFKLVHELGSSHGQTRIIRTAYHEDPRYVPLVRRAFERWYELERTVGRHLLTRCGCLTFGRADSGMVTGVQQSAREHQLPIEVFSCGELHRRFPQFRLPGDYVGVLEQQAGFLYVEDCVRAHIHAARQHGATIQDEEEVFFWQADTNGVWVTTAKGEYRAAKLVITAGPWAVGTLGSFGVLRVMRQTLLWFGTEDDKAYQRNRFPIWLAETPEGYFYGLPVIDSSGLKMAQHYGQPELLDPYFVTRQILPEDEVPARAFLAQHLPGVNGPLRKAQTCIYTLTPDRHFLIDLLPGHANVAVAAGFSGHGFKFASVVGEILADLAEHGSTNHGTDLFRFSRFTG